MSNANKPSVFVVDDELTIAGTVATILNMFGFSAYAFTSTREAMASAEAQAPDLLLSDVMMPRQNGIDFGVRFKAAFPDCKVLLFSGQAGTADLLSKMESKGHTFDLLAKPIHPTDLLTAIEAVMA